MANRAALLRYYEWQVDDRRKVLAELFASLEALDTEEQRLDVESSLEQVKATDMEVGHVIFPGYARGVIEKRNRIHMLRTELEARVEEAQDHLQEAYQELKKIEIMEERRLAEEARQEALREQAELDEIAQIRHQRQEGQGPA